MSIETAEHRIAVRENELVRIDSGRIEQTIRGVQRKLSNTRVGIFVAFSSAMTLINLSAAHILQWLGDGVLEFGIVFEMGFSALFAIAMIRPLLPLQDRLLLRRMCLKGLNECKNSELSSFLRNKRDIEQFEIALTQSNYLEEAERIEYAGRFAIRLIESGEIKEAFDLMVDAQKAAMEARGKIAAIWWLPSFRTERNALMRLNPNERFIDASLGVTGELVIAVFHRLGPHRISDRTFAGPASLERLVEISAITEQGNDSIVIRQNKVLLTIMQLFQFGEASREAQLSEFWDQVGEFLFAEAKADLIPTLTLLALAKASLHLGEAKEAWHQVKARARSNQLETVRSLLPAAFEQNQGMFRDFR